MPRKLTWPWSRLSKRPRVSSTFKNEAQPCQASGDAVSQSIASGSHTSDGSTKTSQHQRQQLQSISQDLEAVGGAESGQLESINCSQTAGRLAPGCVDDHGVASTNADLPNSLVTGDVWTAAFREAVQVWGGHNGSLNPHQQTAERLLLDLEVTGKKTVEGSTFLKGIEILRLARVPLERIKAALDLVSPLTGMEPTAGLVFGVAKSVTAIAIGLASADVQFAAAIGTMLDRMTYIDECDTLGQKVGDAAIHRALVKVYCTILDFCHAAQEVFARNGAILLLEVLTSERIPEKVDDFTKNAEMLRDVVQKATLEVTEDIKRTLYDLQIRTWLDVGAVRDLEGFHNNELRDSRSDEACRLAINHANFDKWSQGHGPRLLTLFGAMGSGKTMTMSYLADELRQTSKSQIPQPKVITHYCQDSKSGHQTFVLSALIFSLLKQLPGLKKGFCQWYLESERTGGPYPASDNRRLRAFLQETLENVDRPLYIVVDGMDECDPRSQGDLLEWFVRVSQTCSRVSILLSARPEQQIHRKLEGTGSMDLKPDIERDSELAKHLVNQNLSDLPEDTRSLMVEGIRRSAGGSAIWLRMIIELVQIRQVHEASLIRRLLTQVSLPRRLSDLYETIVENMTKGDPENYRDIFTALRFLAIARRPLSILELAWAVAMAASPAQVVSVEALSAEVDPQRVIHLIHPFIAMIEFDDVRKRQVKLAHQSVMEFLRARDSSDERTAAGPTFNISQHGSVHHQADRMHDLALDICIRYLSLAEIGQRELFTSTQIAIDELPQATDLFGDPAGPVEYDGKCTWEEWEEDMIRYDPTERGFGDLFVYASCYWLEHLTLSKSPYDLANVEELCRAGSLRMSNWMQQHCRPDCVMKPRFEFDSTLYDPLGIVALYGPDPMFRTMLSQLRLDSDLYLEDTVLAAADQILQWGEPDRLVQMFHDDRLGFQLQTPTFIYMVAERWSDSRFRSRNWEPIFDLLSTDEKARELWEGVESTRCGEFVQRLFYRLISDEDQ